ncbi:hypothetical protein ElyMa_001129600 [Elysia marginata]|uniref:Uncharacterized protein n=1 Tax=Elysia marginata TaxID=1093978 RepID=A0AAV4HY39_9GAST|nr:hypothetical protein ElyMa_001129600 [Elysia marginata]
MKAEWPKAVHRHLQETGDIASVTNFARILRAVWDKCARPEVILKGFVRSGIYPFKPEQALGCGNMASAIFAPQQSPSTPSTPMSPQAAPAMSGTPLSCQAAPSPALPQAGPSSAVSANGNVTLSSRMDKVSGLLHLSHSIGLEMSTKFVRAMKEGIADDDDSGALSEPFREAVFGVFGEETASAAASTASATEATASVATHPTVRHTLATIMAPPQLQRNKLGKKSTSLTMAFSSEEHRSFLKSKEDNAKAEEERKKQNKINRTDERKEVEGEKRETRRKKGRAREEES